MPYRTQGIEDLPRLNTLSVPGLLRGMANTAPVQGPAVQRQELMDRIVAGLGDIPEAAVEIPESTGNMQALLEFLAAIGTGGLAAIPGGVRRARKYGAEESNRKNTEALRKVQQEGLVPTPGTAIPDYMTVGEARGIGAKANADRAAALEKKYSEQADSVKKFEAQLVAMSNEWRQLEEKGRKPTPAFMRQWDTITDLYESAVFRAQSFGQALAAMVGANNPALAGGGMPQPPKLFRFGTQAPAQGAGRPTPASAPTKQTPPAGYTEKVGNGYCVPGTDQCWIPD